MSAVCHSMSLVFIGRVKAKKRGRHKRLNHGRLDETRTEAVDVNFIERVVEGELFGHADYGEFGGTVGRCEGVGDETL